MRYAKFLALSLSIALLVVWSANGQPPPGGGKGKGKGDKGLKAKGKADSQRLVEDFTMSKEQRDQARRILRDYDERVRQAVLEARQDLLGRMKDVLSEADYKQFKDELDLV